MDKKPLGTKQPSQVTPARSPLSGQRMLPAQVAHLVAFPGAVSDFVILLYFSCNSSKPTMAGVLHSFSFVVMFLFVAKEEVPLVHVSVYKSKMHASKGKNLLLVQWES